MTCLAVAALLLGALQLDWAAAGSNVDCVVSDWSDYSKCDELNMKQKRTRTVVQQLEGWGRACPALEDTVTCTPVSCQVSSWSDYSECDDKGYKTRTRTVVQEAKYGGAACKPLSEAMKCNAVDCYVSYWSDWSECLDDGTRVSKRKVLVNPYDGGKECPELERTMSCSDSESSSDSASGSNDTFMRGRKRR